MNDHTINGLLIFGGWVAMLSWCAFVLWQERK